MWQVYALLASQRIEQQRAEADRLRRATYDPGTVAPARRRLGRPRFHLHLSAGTRT